MRIAILFGVLTSIVFCSNAQSSDVKKLGHINIIKDPKLDRMVNYHIVVNEENGTIPGYRIQVISSAKRQNVLEIKSKVQERFPKLNTHLVYQQPYFKVRIGDFHTKLEAYKVLQEVKRHFEDAFIIHDDIDVSLL